MLVDNGGERVVVGLTKTDRIVGADVMKVSQWVGRQHLTINVGIIHVDQSHRAVHKGAAFIPNAVEPIVPDSKPRVAGFGITDFWTMYPRGTHRAGKHGVCVDVD